MSKKPILCLDLLELAWAAGFFDGEGSTSLRKRDTWMELYVQVPQSEITTLQRFQKAVLGMGKIGGPWYSENSNHLPKYRLDFRGYKEAQCVLALLWRFLSEPKRQQAHVAMSACKEYVQKRAKHGRGRSALSLAEATELRERARFARLGRKRLPKGWLANESLNLNLPVNTIEHILKGYGYNGRTQ